MTIKDVLEKLEAQYEGLIAKNAEGERLHPTDLPRIGDVPLIPEEERRRIYDKQEGFEFHGMSSKRLPTIFEEFHGSMVWVPHSCKEYLSLDQFEVYVREAYLRASSSHDVLLVWGNSRDFCFTDMGSYHREEQKIINQEFYWGSTTIDYNAHLNQGVDSAKLGGEHELIKPKLTIIDTPLSPGITFEAFLQRAEDIVNKLFLYMDWTKRE